MPKAILRGLHLQQSQLQTMGAHFRRLRVSDFLLFTSGVRSAALRRVMILSARHKRKPVILSGMAARFCVCVPFLGTRRHGVEESLSPLCTNDRSIFDKSKNLSSGLPFSHTWIVPVALVL